MQEYEILAAELAPLGVRVRAVTPQHGDLRSFLQERGCNLNYVGIISDPYWEVCRDYVGKGVDLVMSIEERPDITKGFGGPHNQVQPAVAIEDGEGNLLYKYTWNDLKSTTPFGADTSGSDQFKGQPQKWNQKMNWAGVYLRPNVQSVVDAIKAHDMSKVRIQEYVVQELDNALLAWQQTVANYNGETVSGVAKVDKVNTAAIALAENPKSPGAAPLPSSMPQGAPTGVVIAANPASSKL